MWFVYDVDNGFDLFETEEEATIFFNMKVEEYRDDASCEEEWCDDVEDLMMGRVTKGVRLKYVSGIEDHKWCKKCRERDEIEDVDCLDCDVCDVVVWEIK